MVSNGRASIRQIQDQIVEEMSDLDDRLEKYEYLIGLGRALSVPDDGIRSDENAVPGCLAQVWIRSEMREGRLHLVADSDAVITRGIIALLLRVLDDQPPQEIVDAELYFVDRTGLSTHLSPSRANGLAAMVRRIRSNAEAQVAPPERAGGQRS